MKHTPFMRRQFVGQYERAVDRAEARQERRAAAANAKRIPYIPAHISAPYGGYGQRAMVSRTGTGREVKCFDVAIANGTIQPIASCAFAEPASSFTGITELNCVQQGSTVYQRIGGKICLRSVRVSFCLTQASSSGNYGCIRALVIYDKQTNGSAPAIGDILAENNSAAPGYNSDLNIVNRNRFIVLRDQNFSIDPAAQLTHEVDWYIKTRFDTEYKSSGNTIGDITTGGIFLIVFGLFFAGNGAVQAIHSRLRYDD